jgi:hypothetical protein
VEGTKFHCAHVRSIVNTRATIRVHVQDFETGLREKKNPAQFRILFGKPCVTSAHISLCTVFLKSLSNAEDTECLCELGVHHQVYQTPLLVTVSSHSNAGNNMLLLSCHMTWRNLVDRCRRFEETTVFRVMELEDSSKTLVIIYKTTRHHIPDDGNLHSNR